MADLSLQIKQSQNITMTPQMQQSIKMLQMTTLDLAPYIATQIEQNPFLESTEPQNDENIENVQDIAENEVQSEKEVNGNEPEQVWSDDEVSPAVYDGDSATYSGVNNKSTDFSDNDYGMDQLSSPEKTLKDHVTDQINIDISDPAQRLIAVHLTDMLDDTGYIKNDFASICNILQCDEKQIEEVLGILQKFDPCGIFSRNLSECLAIQLKEKDRFDPAMQQLVENLDLLGKRDFKLLLKKCSVNEEDLADMIEEIKALNPKPGDCFANEHVQILQPDVFLKKGEKGKWNIELNNEALPKALVNRRYYSEVEKQVKDKESKKFLTEQFNNANWLVKALDQRANTILKVSTEIVTQQDSFFRYGIHHLKPLVLSDIAAAIEMHESTVSRVINGKHIATHMGLYELKYFFSSSLGSSNGSGDISSKRIKFMIKELIDSEDPKKILSDDKLASILKERGIDVARRTVMKYRESMNIGSSVQRRREKKIL